MFNERLLANFYIAFEAVLANKVRSLLTALGIIFGVAAVIAMLAIGTGAQQEIMEQIKLVGVNNIVVVPVVEQVEEQLDESSSLEKERSKFSPGLKLQDAEAIREIIPGISKISPEIVLDTYIVKSGVRRSAKLVGVTPAYFDVLDFKLRAGRMFSEKNLVKGDPVCIIGRNVAARFFPNESPIGKKIKSGSQWLEVVGILEERIVSESSISKLGIRDFNMDVYVPIQTMLIRYKNRDLVTESRLNDSNSGSSNYHQLDKMVIQVSESELLNPTAEVLAKMLERRHFNVVDFEITIPELLLKQQQRTQNIFNIVLGAIAGISLLVGGIGIMNIMLASVMERIKEIGLRLSLGAKKNDIVNQFLFESIMISVSGGLIGVILGIVLAHLVSTFADFPTVITLSSIVLSFGVAATVGLVFGITPAKRAASQDPITSLRYE
ncbi:putative ABC transport system permease protein [Cyclobacterium xiamenense]|uniref:Putative ABC transport system permease protein n=1 Tax=Cyclobacterium xiamenense TaxID=1297121 RepID=A0A1H7BQB8_9BACT|nr:ABC transporter permease [Cyclobacterium xiamenense]SEJ79671.1 putative ABC transport system permease protein [Cyclobacterium xiamenense]